jgi:Fe-S-cluster-containing dehydrogenase component
MDSTRRRFLQVASLSVLGLGVKPAFDAKAAEPKVSVDPKALVGKRWAMVVDMKQCVKEPEGCKKCIDACHSTHNVPNIGNKKDEVKWIWKAGLENAFPEMQSPALEGYMKDTLKGRPLILLCNHCDNPPCVRVCPVQATFRRPDGIVMMDYHRCIGCRFCMAACPFGARSLNWRDPRPFIKTETMNRKYPTRMRGVVEKCTFCSERLAEGLKPSCVEACKEKCLTFGDLEDPNSEVSEILRKHPSVQRKPELGTRPQVYYIL